MQKITDNPSEPCNIIDISLGLSRLQKHEKPPTHHEFLKCQLLTFFIMSTFLLLFKNRQTVKILSSFLKDDF